MYQLRDLDAKTWASPELWFCLLPAANKMLRKVVENIAFWKAKLTHYCMHVFFLCTRHLNYLAQTKWAYSKPQTSTLIFMYMQNKLHTSASKEC